MSVSRPYPDKMDHWAILYGRYVYGRDYPYTLTDEKNSPDVIQLVPFYTDTDVLILILTGRRGKGAYRFVNGKIFVLLLRCRI